MDTPRTPLFEKTSFLITGSIIIVLLIVVQFFLWKYIQSYAGKIYMRQTNAQQTEALSQKIAEAQRGLLEQQRKLVSLSAIFPPKDGVSQVVGRIESIADTRRLKLDIMSIEDGEPVESGKDAMFTKVFSLQATGPIDTLFAFFEALEHQTELVHVASWSVAAPPPSQTNTLGAPQAPQEFVLTLKVIYYFYDADNSI